jgi:formimidoylglutamate deiminase
MSTRDAAPVAQYLRVAHLHQPGGWRSPGYLEIDGDGTIVSVFGEQPAHWQEVAIHDLAGYVLPGAINLHSHAHQRGLAGRAEGGAGATEAENFWSWRERMYAFLLGLSPDDFEAIAAQAYVEMLRAGFTTAGEFHYLHHDRDGGYYADAHEMAARVLSASDQTGIALTILPSLYTRGGIGRPAAPEQRRFVHRSVDDYLRLVEWLQAAAQQHPLLRVGVAPHSLRAVGAEELAQVVEAVSGTDAPIHLHVAEQAREVEECMTGLGAPPARWLLDHCDVNARWTFIHATHCTRDELRDMAGRGVVVGLCPTTEGNLGDGLFALRDYQGAGGGWGIGTDANLVPDPALELRLLEYGQRLITQRRSILITPGNATTEQPGRRLYDLALDGGARSLAQPAGALTAGRRADLVELDPTHPALAGQQPGTVLDGWLVAGSRELVRNVMVGGRWVVRDGHHAREDEIAARFGDVMRHASRFPRPVSSPSPPARAEP